MKKFVLFLFLASSVVAQAPKPELTTTEKLALQALSQQFNEVQKNIADFKTEVEKAHPGYTLDPKGGLVEIKKAEPEKK